MPRLVGGFLNRYLYIIEFIIFILIQPLVTFAMRTSNLKKDVLELLQM